MIIRVIVENFIKSPNAKARKVRLPSALHGRKNWSFGLGACAVSQGEMIAEGAEFSAQSGNASARSSRPCEFDIERVIKTQESAGWVMDVSGRPGYEFPV